MNFSNSTRVIELGLYSRKNREMRLVAQISSTVGFPVSSPSAGRLTSSFDCDMAVLVLFWILQFGLKQVLK